MTIKIGDYVNFGIGSMTLEHYHEDSITFKYSNFRNKSGFINFQKGFKGYTDEETLKRANRFGVYIKDEFKRFRILYIFTKYKDDILFIKEIGHNKFANSIKVFLLLENCNSKMITVQKSICFNVSKD